MFFFFLLFILLSSLLSNFHEVVHSIFLHGGWMREGEGKEKEGEIERIWGSFVSFVFMVRTPKSSSTCERKAFRSLHCRH